MLVLKFQKVTIQVFLLMYLLHVQEGIAALIVALHFTRFVFDAGTIRVPETP